MATNPVEVGIIALIERASGVRKKIVNAPSGMLLMFSQYDSRRTDKRNSVFFTVDDGTRAGDPIRVFVSFVGTMTSDPDLYYFTGYCEKGRDICGSFNLSDRNGELIFLD